MLDALDVTATEALIRATGAGIVLNLGSAFLNMPVLQACLHTGAAYIDTAIHEDPSKVCETPPWYANYEWKRREACERAGVTAILGAGFDPGVVNAYARLAVDEYFDRVNSIDIIDVNAGSHGRYFATNFDPEVNFREFTGVVWYWQGRQWQKAQMFDRRREWDLPEVGLRIAEFQTENLNIELIAYDGPAEFARRVMGDDFGINHLTIQVEDVADAVARLADAGLRVQEGFPRRGAHGTVAFFRRDDTTGLLFEVCAPDAVAEDCD